MSQGFGTYPATSGGITSAEVRNNFLALVTMHSGSSAPSPTYEGMWWMDDVTDPTNVIVYRRLGSAWVTVFEHFEGLAGGHAIQFLGNANYFEHTQSTPLTSWSVAHNLDKYPSVTVTNTAGLVIAPVSITYVDRNNVTLTFSPAQDGYAYCN